MRLALGTAPPASFWYRLKNQPRMPVLSSGRSGAFVSATRTSPFGNTYSHRGCSSPFANAVTVVPAAPVGFVSLVHPTASTTLIVGSGEVFGGGRIGVGPVPSVTASRADAPQPAVISVHET